MTEYDYSPQAYERYLATQTRIANWVDKTEQHRGEFQSANSGLPDLTRSGPSSASYPKPKQSSSPRRQLSGPSQPNQLIIYPPPQESSSSSSSSGYYEGPWPAQIQQPTPGMVLPPMQQHPLSSPPPMMMAPPFVTSPHRVPHHHRHRSHDRRRSHSHHSPKYYSLASPPLSPGYQYTYPGANQGYVMMPQYGGTQMPLMVCQFFPIVLIFPHSLSLLSYLFILSYLIVSPILLKYCLIFVHISLLHPYQSQGSRSAPASVTEFVVPTAQASYPQVQPNSAFVAPNPPTASSQAWSTYGVAPYSIMSNAVGSPPLQPLPYPGLPTFQSFSAQPLVQPSYLLPPRAHQRIYDLSKPDKYYKQYVG